MSYKIKNEIHNEIDIKLKELESLNLSKEEILLGSNMANFGIPLKDDPTFQTILNDRDARE